METPIAVVLTNGASDAPRTQPVESLEDEFRTKSDEDVFAETLPARSTRRRSSFPLISVSVSTDCEDSTGETVSLCDASLLGNDRTPSAAHSTGVLVNGRKSHISHRRLHELQAPSNQLGLGSTLSIASHRLVKSQCIPPVPFSQADPSLKVEPPKRRWYQLMQQSSVQFGLDFCYATEGALVTPILLQLGLPDHLYGLAWFLAPILGFILTPLIGSLSDRCYSPMGQRRPFILAMGIGVILGTGLYLNSADLGAAISAENATVWGIAITVVGVILTDLCADSSNSPFKAYLMDTCSLDDLKRALSMRSMLGGIGGGLGYICIAVDWNQTVFGQALGSQLRVIFVLNLLCFTIPLILTLTSIPEIPLTRAPSSVGSKVKDVETASETDQGSGVVGCERCMRQTGASSLWRRILKIFSWRKHSELEESRREQGCCDGSCEPLKEGERSACGGGSGCGTCHQHGQRKGEKCTESIPNGKHDSCHKNDNKRKHFIIKKKPKKCSKKVRQAGGVAESSLIVKVGANDDTRDIVIAASKNAGGNFPNQNGAPPPHCITETTGGAMAICISNPAIVDVSCGDDDEGGESDDDDDNKPQPQSLVKLLCSAIHMPKELRYLSISNFFSWASYIIILCFYTDFVAQAVYHGDPSAPVGSEENLRYEEGVKMGSWGLCVYAFTSFLVGLSMTVLQRYFSQRFLYSVGQLLFAVSCGCMGLLTNYPPAVLFLCVAMGLDTVIIMTIPHNILAYYHKCDKYKCPEGGLPRGLGTDMACIDIQVFLSQITISAVMGPLIQVTGSHVTIVVSAALLGLLASLSAAFLVTYEVKEK